MRIDSDARSTELRDASQLGRHLGQRTHQVTDFVVALRAGVDVEPSGGDFVGERDGAPQLGDDSALGPARIRPTAAPAATRPSRPSSKVARRERSSDAAIAAAACASSRSPIAVNAFASATKLASAPSSAAAAPLRFDVEASSVWSACAW